MERKYIFITGGVVSGLGKGTMAASLGRLLKARGFKVTNQKFDPYINVDPGTMSPFRHGEVFVTEDGAECDLDIGHYERFIDENLTSESNITSGKIYLSVIDKERKGGYMGKDVQVIPHITDEIKSRILNSAKASKADIAIVEIGGTVGDIESLPFLEAIRQMTFDVGRGNVLFVHLTLVPYLQTSGEMKSKPTQHSVKELLSIGIQPDIIVCRAHRHISKEIREKIALFCNVRKDCVIQNIDAKNIYEIPLLLEEEGLAALACEKLEMTAPEPELDEWRALTARRRAALRTVNIALVGKYVSLHDAYLSVTESLNHAAVFNDVSVKINWVDAEELEKSDDFSLLENMDGVLVPGGFGERGTLGKIKAVKYARENKIPFFGICLGLQCAVIEYARNVLGHADAYTTEFSPDTATPIIELMPEQKGAKTLGGTMRRGAYPCSFEKGSLCMEAYGREKVEERHRHRYEFNMTYADELAAAGMRISGTSDLGGNVRAEAFELSRDEHPWFVAVQFHPEFKSRPNRPHPLFLKFVEAAAVRE